MNILENFDIISVAFAVASTFVLGFTIYFTDRGSITSKTFLLFSIITGSWGLANFFGYRLSNPDTAFLLLRAVMFLAVLQAFSIFQLFYVFPKTSVSFSKKYKYILIPFVGIVAIISASPLVLSHIAELSNTGRILTIANGPAIPVFGLVSVSLVAFAVYIFIKNLLRAPKEEKAAYVNILVGTVLMFGFIITFNFIFPAVFNNSSYLPFGALLTFPFAIFTTYAILRNKLFSVKVISTATLVFVISMVLFVEVVFSDSLFFILFRSGIFLLVLFFGISLIRSVIQEVKQREQLQILSDQLFEANEKLKGLDKLKSEFLSLASHQIRSPLTAIKGYASMVVDGDFGEISDKAKEAVDRIFKSSQSLTLMVEDFLNVSKIEQGGMKYVKENFDITSVASTMAQDLSVTAEGKGLKMTYTQDEGNHTVFGDKEKIRQVILNFIDNSIKYTKEGSIDVSVKNTNGKVLFAVKDTGMGMTEEIKNTLFQKFSRGEGAKMNTTGSGIGLYLAKEIISAHDGRVWVESPGPNLGSTFFIELAEAK